MSDTPANRLYDLLPALYRLRDDATGGQLRALLDVIAEQLDLVEDDIDQMYQNWFIETAQEWLVPYIGDLLGVKPLHTVAGETSLSLRAYVANTIAYRRRKGTAAVLEDLARAVSGWPARSVEFFQRVHTTQNLNHRNPNRRSVNLREMDTLDRLDGPFDSLTHTADVRPPAQANGWHSIKRVGLFLWLLKAYPLRNVTARRSTSHPFGWHFHPLGTPVTLFNQPGTPGELARLAAESDLPAPIRPLAFALDLAAYRLENAALAPARRPANSLYYGPDRSLSITIKGQPVPPLEVTAWNLKDWDRPPAGVSGRFSGDLSAFPALPATPQLRASIGGVGPLLLTLAGPPADLPGLRSALESALRGASPAAEFSRAQVLLDGSRLVVLPGRTGVPLTFSAAPADAATLDLLKLGAASAELRGALSAEMDWLPGPADPNPRFQVRLGTAGPHLVTLAARPNTPAEARSRLEDALRAAGPQAEFTQARVLLHGQRLLVLPGVDGVAVTFRPVPADRASVEQFGLSNKIGVDVRLGRLAFALGENPAPGEVLVHFSYGFSADMGGGPYLRHAEEEQETSLLIAVRKGGPIPDLTQALTAWNDAGKPPAVIEIQDNGLYAENPAIAIPVSGRLTIRAAPECFPVLRPGGPLNISAPAEGAGLTLEGLLIEGELRLSGGLRLNAQHCTLVPGGGVTEQGQPAQPNQPSISQSGGGAGEMSVTLEHCISGPLLLPATSGSLTVRDSILHAPAGAANVIQAAIAAGLDGVLPGPPLTIERSTVFGLVHVRQIDLASETIFNHSVRAGRRQVGCTRYCWFPLDSSQVPAPFRCQPELALTERAQALSLPNTAALPAVERSGILARVRPEYTSEHYPQAAYAQLALNCAVEIRTGGELGSEMGAFNALLRPQREANLNQTLPEFLPFGMDLALIQEP